MIFENSELTPVIDKKNDRLFFVQYKAALQASQIERILRTYK